MLFDDLLGKVFEYYGSDNHCFKIDDMVWEAMEDEDDGYRSCLGSVQRLDRNDLIFYNNPFARVMLEYNENSSSDLYCLRDVVTNHVWLEFGTNNTDDYYPMFTFRCMVCEFWNTLQN